MGSGISLLRYDFTFMMLFLQNGNHGDPVLHPYRPPFLPGPSYNSGGLQVSAPGPEESLLLDQRDLRSAERHHLRLNPH